MSGVVLEPKHIKSKKVIGKTDNGEDLSLVTTYGGLQIIMLMKNNKAEIVGAGAHIAISKFEAEKKLKHKLKWDDED